MHVCVCSNTRKRREALRISSGKAVVFLYPSDLQCMLLNTCGIDSLAGIVLHVTYTLDTIRHIPTCGMLHCQSEASESSLI